MLLLRGKVISVGWIRRNKAHEPSTSHATKLIKVLHVIPSMSPFNGGPTQAIHEYIRALSRQGGLIIDIATTHDNSTSAADTVIQGCHRLFSFPRTLPFYSFCWRLFVWLGRHVADYNLLHVHALFSFPVIAAAVWAWIFRVPFIIQPHGILNKWGMDNRRPLLKRLSLRCIERHILDWAIKIHFTSNQERTEAGALASASKSVVIPLCVDVAKDLAVIRRSQRFLRKYPQIKNKKVLLFLSRIDRKKGLELLLEAFSGMDRRGLILMIAGTGDVRLERALKRNAIDLGVAADVVWTGFLTDREKWTALHVADVFVLPSWSESFGLSVIEAMAVGTPVVITDQVGIHPEIRSGNAGVVTGCYVSEIAEALNSILRDGDLRSELSANGTLIVSERFSPSPVGALLAKTYFEVARPYGSGAVNVGPGDGRNRLKRKPPTVAERPLKGNRSWA